MDIAPATARIIRLMDAIGKAALSSSEDARLHHGRNYGVFVIDRAGGDATGTVRTIATALGRIVEVMDSHRTNLNDLEVFDSPLRQLSRDAYKSQRGYVFVLRGWVPEMGSDPRIAHFRECFGGEGKTAIVLSETAEGMPAYFVPCDLIDL